MNYQISLRIFILILYSFSVPIFSAALCLEVFKNEETKIKEIIDDALNNSLSKQNGSEETFLKELQTYTNALKANNESKQKKEEIVRAADALDACLSKEKFLREAQQAFDTNDFGHLRVLIYALKKVNSTISNETEFSEFLGSSKNSALQEQLNNAHNPIFQIQRLIYGITAGSGMISTTVLYLSNIEFKWLLTLVSGSATFATTHWMHKRYIKAYWPKNYMYALLQECKSITTETYV